MSKTHRQVNEELRRTKSERHMDHFDKVKGAKLSWKELRDNEIEPIEELPEPEYQHGWKSLG